jgi:hypothetical protein
VWERKGKIVGVHPDFGRASFFCENGLPLNYHCNQEEMVELILEMISLLETFEGL